MKNEYIKPTSVVSGVPAKTISYLKYVKKADVLDEEANLLDGNDDVKASLLGEDSMKRQR